MREEEKEIIISDRHFIRLFMRISGSNPMAHHDVWHERHEFTTDKE